MSLSWGLNATVDAIIQGQQAAQSGVTPTNANHLTEKRLGIFPNLLNNIPIVKVKINHLSVVIMQLFTNASGDFSMAIDFYVLLIGPTNH
jgi:hypothetical protein